MAGLSAGSGLSQTSTTSGGYVRPSDWPALPVPAADGINMLAMISPYGDVYTAINIQATGGYTVNWGDGTIDSWATNVPAQHTYNYSTLTAAVTSRGYKTAIVQVYPTVAGSSITYFDLGVKNTAYGASGGGAAIWLDVSINTPSATGIHFRSTLVPYWMEICNIIACGNLTGTALNSCWNGCNSLAVLNLPIGFGANVTGLNSTFNGSAIQSLVLPAGFGALVTDFTATFNQCYALTNLALPAGFGSAATTLSSTFNGCAALKSLALPAGLGASATTVDNMFASCNLLQNITFPANFGALATAMDAIFISCWALENVVFPSGFGAGMLTMPSAFDGCYSIRNITFTTPLGAHLTNTSFAFRACINLATVTGYAPIITSTISPSAMGSAALNALYTGLPTIVTQTLTVSGNYGYAASTPTIATAKGWTVN